MKKGFTLVELSIVLVILGILVGGILAGKSLIRAAELRGVSADVQRYTSALNAFRDKYMGLPGDITNAESFWGSATTCPTGAHSGTQTCNGDNSGFINSYFYRNMAGWSVNLFEGANGWQQMSNAGLIDGKYTGSHGATVTPGEDVPASKIGAGAGFTWASIGTQTGVIPTMTSSGPPGAAAPNPINIPPTSALMWNTLQSARAILYLATGPFSATVLSPEEAWNIDTKRDDGKPDYGSVQGGSPSSTCYTGATAPSAYAMGVTDKVCSIFFVVVP
jgi:prepilin-type N-terminal cleavage/methylation domain-containing protein